LELGFLVEIKVESLGDAVLLAEHEVLGAVQERLGLYELAGFHRISAENSVPVAGAVERAVLVTINRDRDWGDAGVFTVDFDARAGVAGLDTDLIRNGARRMSLRIG
jgi:hypothetical protein